MSRIASPATTSTLLPPAALISYADQEEEELEGVDETFLRKERELR